VRSRSAPLDVRLSAILLALSAAWRMMVFSVNAPTLGPISAYPRACLALNVVDVLPGA
jgi:hypothetical protein